MRLIQNIRINYIYLQLDFLLYREVLSILLLGYKTHYHIETHDMIVFKSALREYLLTHVI
jgi:hypothetical protein